MMKEAIQHIRDGLEKYIVSNNIQSLVLGVSGGIDSALVCALVRPICDKMGIKLIGYMLPGASNQQSENDRAAAIASSFCNETYHSESLVDYITTCFRIFFMNKSLQSALDDNIAIGNVKARVRMITLYNMAYRKKGLVLSTDNYTEYMLGFWTLHGDVGDYGPIQEYWKTEVYDMSEYLVNELKDTDPKASEALSSCIDALATDGLGINPMGDLGQILPDFIGTSRDGYRIVDNILKDYLSNPTVGKQSSPVITRHLKTQFKRAKFPTGGRHDY